MCLIPRSQTPQHTQNQINSHISALVTHTSQCVQPDILWGRRPPLYFDKCLSGRQGHQGSHFKRSNFWRKLCQSNKRQRQSTQLPP